MRKEIKKAPIIRFRGFTDDWEQRKLAQFFFTATEKNDDGEYSQADILAASLGTELEKKHIFFGLRSTAESVKKYRKVQLGDIVYTKSPIKHYPNGIFKTCKKIPGIVLSMYCVYHKRGNIKINTSIVQCFFENKYRLDNYLRPLVNVGARNNVNITDEEALKGTITIPINIEEQTKIVNLIEKLTILITLHQHKLDQLKKLKKFFLQNMFPAKGEKVPRIRFKGFTGDWEQRKLGNISAFITKGSTPTTYGYHWVDYGIPFFRNDSIQENTFVYGNYSYISNEANDALKRSEITAKDILIAITGEIGKVGIVPDNIKKANINQHMARVRISKEAVPYFVYQYLATGKIQNEYQKIKTGLSMPQLSLEQIRNTTILLPCYEEQFKISDYLSGLDNLITLHQRKLNQLLTMKKFMLQNLFI